MEAEMERLCRDLRRTMNEAASLADPNSDVRNAWEVHFYTGPPVTVYDDAEVRHLHLTERTLP